MYLYREYFKANVYTIWVHGPSGVHVGFMELSKAGVPDPGFESQGFVGFRAWNLGSGFRAPG